MLLLTQSLLVPFGPTPPLLTIIGLAYLTPREEGLQLDCRSAEQWMRGVSITNSTTLLRYARIVSKLAADMPVLKQCWHTITYKKSMIKCWLMQ